MEILQSVITAIGKNCYFGSIDIADAFYTIPICESDRRYIRFVFNNTKLKFKALITGYNMSSYIFSKIVIPVFKMLRLKGHISTVYIDDTCLQGQSYETCKNNITDTVQILDKLGFTISIEKSVLEPTQKITFLGFVLCSVTMTVQLTTSKCEDIINMCKSVISKKRVTLHQFAQLIGKLVTVEPGVQHAPLFISKR